MKNKIQNQKTSVGGNAQSFVSNDTLKKVLAIDFLFS